MLLVLLVSQQADENEELQISQVVLAGLSPGWHVVRAVLNRHLVDLVELDLARILAFVLNESMNKLLIN